MPFVNTSKIIAQKVNMLVTYAVHDSGPQRENRDVGFNLCPLPKTWYEEEVDTETTKTIRFARRKDHTGILVKIDKAEFLKLRGPPS